MIENTDSRIIVSLHDDGRIDIFSARRRRVQKASGQVYHRWWPGTSVQFSPKEALRISMAILAAVDETYG